VSIDVTAAVEVHRAPAGVWAYMTDPANEPEWIGGVREARLVGPPPLARGSRVERVAGFLGRRIDYVNEVTELDPPRLLDMRSVVAPFPMRITYTLAGDAAGPTTVRNRVRGNPSGFFSMAAGLMAPLVKRSIQRDLERLRDVLERAV
jgi:uncharacterized protein YndB with AHSA1/START domain